MKDDIDGRKVSNNFLANCGIAHKLQKRHLIVAPKKPEDMVFKEIEAAMRKYLQPKKQLILAERTRFYSLRQSPFSSVN